MKLLGLSAGKKMGNCEVLVKEALMGAEESGIDVEIIRLLDLNIKPCTGCASCLKSLHEGGSGKCTLKDDFNLLDEKIMECDGLILASPVFVLSPHGIIKVLSDRLGPSHDVTFKMESNKIRKAKGITDGDCVDERSFKKRVAGFIAVGGATTYYPVALALPLMNLFTVSSHIQVVDQMQVRGTSLFAHVVLNPPVIDRAKKLGINLAKAMKSTDVKIPWMGDEPGTCPSCHSNLLIVSNHNPIMCPICGIDGKLETDGDRITVSFSEAELKKSRMNFEGLLKRWTELSSNLSSRPPEIIAQIPQIPEKLKKYEGYKETRLK